MSNDNNNREERREKIIAIIVVIFLSIAVLLGFEEPRTWLANYWEEITSDGGVFEELGDELETILNQFGNPEEGQPPKPTTPPVIVENPEGTLVITMIECGQADSFLLQQDGKVALIDCGTRSTGDDVVSYLKEQGITRIDYLIGTHPHDDHMGGMHTVLTNFEIGAVIIPKVKNGEVTANWYLKLVRELKKDKYVVEYAQKDSMYLLGDAMMTIIGPLSEPKDNINNYSTVMMVTFGEIDILFTGDAEVEVEEELLKSGVDLDAEILKVGHHGSDTSSSEEFLDAVSPEYALISCKIGNKYDHPTESTMNKLEERDIEVYRTDESGTVVVTIEDDKVNFSCEPGNYLSGVELEEKYGND